MKVGYYPGCTLKTKASNLDETVTGSLDALNVEYHELERWNCCGAAFSLQDDNLINLVGPVRNLVRVKEVGCDTVITACSLCYNSLARANLIMKEDAEKAETINAFMEEEIDYNGEVEVLHILNFLKEKIGFDNIKKQIKKPLDGLKIAPYYGCLLVRPREIAIDNRSYPKIFEEFIVSIGAEPVEFSSAYDCCGSYQIISNQDLAAKNCRKILDSAVQAKADVIASSCPLCEYNIGIRQNEFIKESSNSAEMPTFYFTQMLAVALGVEQEKCHFELNTKKSVEFLKERKLVSV